MQFTLKCLRRKKERREGRRESVGAEERSRERES